MLFASAMPRSVTVPSVASVHRAIGFTPRALLISVAPAPVTVHCAVGVRCAPYSSGKRYCRSAVQKWLLENSWRYGFILRYPTDQTDVTGIVYEPWHYRYVGKEYAQDIYKKGLCLEQYLEQWGK